MIPSMPRVSRLKLAAFLNADLGFVTVLAAVGLAVFAGTARATDPHIDLIERFGTDRVTIHFNTDAGRTYTLQFSGTLNSGIWSNLTTIPADPSPNHYILVAPATNGFGLFRLLVTP
jgi:hypothetical protein